MTSGIGLDQIDFALNYKTNFLNGHSVSEPSAPGRDLMESLSFIILFVK